MAGVYVHIPYCGKLCSYCDFHFSVSVKDKPQMIDSICKEINLRSDFFKNHSIETVYIGGGTPSYCTIEELSKIIGTIRRHIDFSGVVEFTLEANPEDLTKEYLSELKLLGINRLSIGIQSFDNDILRFFNRRHDSDKAVEAIVNAKACGFDNITIDLIYGVNGFELSRWYKSVDKALTLGVQHISAYHLTIDKGSVLGHKLQKGEVSQIEDSYSILQFNYLHENLHKAGYEHYEVSNFAKKGFMSKHNSSYWNGTEYIGFGASAHSFDGNCRQWNISNNRRYIESIEQGTVPCEVEDLGEIEKYNEYVMISLRTARGIDGNHIKSQFSAYLYEYFLNQVAKNKIIHNEGNRYYILPTCFLLSDMVITDLIYAK